MLMKAMKRINVLIAHMVKTADSLTVSQLTYIHIVAHCFISSFVKINPCILLYYSIGFVVNYTYLQDRVLHYFKYCSLTLEL